jgi:hypothetical protein
VQLVSIWCIIVSIIVIQLCYYTSNTNIIIILFGLTAIQIEYDKLIKEAEAKAMAIRAITEAEYEKKVRECEAASRMPTQEV